MKAITKFEAIDGKEFNTENECLDYENLIRQVNAIMAFLPARPENDGCRFANGNGFIQHDKSLLRKARIQLLQLIKKHVDHHWVQQAIDDPNIHPSWVARLLDDYNIKPIYNAWYRFSCTDSLGREWGQPYYASHPNEASKQQCINS